MVFHFGCFPSGDVQEDLPTDIFLTAPTHFSLRVFTLDELEKATANFDQSTKIGEGRLGNVHRGTIKNPRDDIHVAVKQVTKGPKGDRQWETEVNNLGEIKHPNLVKLIGYGNEDYGNESNCLLVYEYMPNGSLDDHLSGKSNEHLSWSKRLSIARDAAIGLQYLHEGLGEGRQIIFRDFKPSNVLLDDNWNAKLSDFGFVRDGPQDGRTHVSIAVGGTKGYAAPECVQSGLLTYKIDVWSYGVFLEELMTGRPPAQVNSENDLECMRWVCCYSNAGKSKLIVDPRLEGKYSKKSMQMVSSIAKKCLVKNPTSRPKMSEVLLMVNKAIALENQSH